MALKVLLLRKKLTDKQTALAELERAAQDFETREAELAADIEAAQTDEERAVVEEAANAFDAECAQNAADTETVRADIAELERQIREAAAQGKKLYPGQI